MKIINFSIIAHIDHGKSTLASSFLTLGSKERIGATSAFLDNMDLEKERGITIKSKTIRLFYTYKGQEYQLNMVDTPGHVDFSYEVSKALYACDYSLLLVDATKGVQAQTVSNAYKAISQNVEIIPVINKIDAVNADIKRTEEEIINTLGFLESNIYKISAKKGTGVKELLEKLIEKSNSQNNTLRGVLTDPKALIFDSFYDEYLGVVIMCLIKGGNFVQGQPVYLYSNKQNFEIKKLGYFGPVKTFVNELLDHEVGFIVTGLKDLSKVNIGDTILPKGKTSKPFPGFEIVKPLVYLGVFPASSENTENLRKALNVLHLEDASFTYKPESAGNLGYGFNCGFLGLLHADIILERIKREFNIEITVTTPSVSYIIKQKDGKEYEIASAREFPDPSTIHYTTEPMVSMNIVTPEEFVGRVLNLTSECRGKLLNTKFSNISDRKTVNMGFKIPLSEIIVDFDDKLKSLTSGFASFDYDLIKYDKSDIVKLDILIAGENFQPLASLVHVSKAEILGRKIIQNLKNALPKEQFSIALQAAIGGKIIARETLKAYRKDVTSKLYGGDQTRKMKLLEKQKKGKKKMQKVGKVNIDKETFLRVIRKP